MLAGITLRAGRRRGSFFLKLNEEESMERLNSQEVARPIAVDLGEADIKEAMRIYMEFIALDDFQKHMVNYPGDGVRRNTPAGYNHTRTERGGNTIDTSKDNKHIFHYTPDVGRMAESVPDRYKSGELHDFLTVAEEIWHASAMATRRELKEMEESFPGLVGIHFPDSGDTNNHLRFLAYEPGTDGILARGHYDKSASTIALAESHGGLRLGKQPEDLELYGRDPNQPVFFHGLGWTKLHKLLGKASLALPAWHDVVDTGERIDDNVMRWALIYFINPAYLDTAPSSIETHTPLVIDRLGELSLEDQLEI